LEKKRLHQRHGMARWVRAMESNKELK
jgi:hypothetical protein